MDVSIDEIGRMYQRAVANDWRTLQAATQQSLNRYAASEGAAAEAAALLRVARAVAAGENGKVSRIFTGEL